MNFKEEKVTLINELNFYEFNEEEIKKLAKNEKKNPILTDLVKKKLLLTCFLIFLIRLGNYIQIPGVNLMDFYNLTKSNLIPGIENNFYNSNSIPTLFCLGIGPSINASIIMQLILTINPELKKLQREEGELGRRKIAQYTRYLTLFLSILQSIFLIYSIKYLFYNWSIETAVEICCFLTTGAMITLWISEKITKNGITNGSSLLVYLNIIGNTPKQFQASLPYINSYQLLLILLTLIITMGGVILLQQSVTFIPMMTSKIGIKNNQTDFLKQKTFFPIKLNQAGVMPIVFASYLLPIIKSFGLFLISNINHIFNISINLPNVVNQFIYFITEFSLICIFASFYSLLIIDPKDVSENLQKSAFFIPGIRPGKQTFIFFKKVFERHALIGGILLAINAAILNFAGLVIKLPILQGIGIGSQIILVGVTIEVIQKIRALMISEIYKKYLKSNN
jgi:preprotein translocase subunit SecY